jgi:hypothetical protein
MHGYSKEKEYAVRSKVDTINSITFDFLLFATCWRQPRSGCEGVACELLRDEELRVAARTRISTEPSAGNDDDFKFTPLAWSAP